LVAASWPISLEDFNLYVFRGLHSDYKKKEAGVSIGFKKR
jgi:hypothetical protein